MKYREIGTFFHYKHEAETALRGQCQACHGTGQVHDRSGPNGDSVGMMTCWKCKGACLANNEKEVAMAKETMEMVKEGLCLYCQFPMADHPHGSVGCSQQDCFWAMVKYLHKVVDNIDEVVPSVRNPGMRGL